MLSQVLHPYPDWCTGQSIPQGSVSSITFPIVASTISKSQLVLDLLLLANPSSSSPLQWHQESSRLRNTSSNSPLAPSLGPSSCSKFTRSSALNSLSHLHHESRGHPVSEDGAAPPQPALPAALGSLIPNPPLPCPVAVKLFHLFVKSTFMHR